MEWSQSGKELSGIGIASQIVASAAIELLIFFCQIRTLDIVLLVLRVHDLSEFYEC